MKSFSRIISAAAAVLVVACSSPKASVKDVSGVADATPDQVTRVEPLSWWIGMNTPLQILVQGPSISEYDLCIEGLEGVAVEKTHKADSPNYLFADVKIASTAQPGTCYLVFTKDSTQFKYPYELGRKSTAKKESFSSKDMIYLIMPDRFVNADKSNDNAPGMTEQADAQAFFGRHGGDIEGISGQLPYIAELGFTAIWNTPLLEDNVVKESYHGYACTDYYHIDPRFGTNADYKALVDAAHANGIKMIMDIVPNHCGDKHWWMEDLPFEDWVHVWPEYMHSNCCFSVQNDPYCPEIDRQEMEAGWFDRSMVDMNLDNPYLLQYFKQWAAWWIEYAGLDGLRVDTYPYNEKVPMSQWCKSVRDEYPWINIVGEVWSNNLCQVTYWQTGNNNKDGFDSYLPSVMDFPLHTAICEALTYRGGDDWNGGMVKVYESVANDFFYADRDNVLIFPGNHDIERLGDILGRDMDRQKIAMTLIATLRGIPQMLYGEEFMMVSRDLRQGHGGLRVDFPLEWEKNAKFAAMHEYCSTLFNWRKGASAVWNGSLKHYLTRDNTYAYFRYNDEQTVFVYINNNDKPVQIPWERYSEVASGIQSGKNVITGETVDFTKTITVGPKQSIIVECAR